MSDIEKLSELMRGLEFEPYLANATPQQLFLIGQAVAAQAKQAPTLTARVAELEAALKPFANNPFIGWPADSPLLIKSENPEIGYLNSYLTVAYLQRAAAVLNKETT